MKNVWFLALIALTLFLLPLHSLITAEIVLTITLIIFYSHQFLTFSNLKNRGVTLAFLLTAFLLVVTAISIQRPINFHEVYRLFLIIWSIPFFIFCLKKYGPEKIIFISLLVLSLHGLWGITQFIFQHSLGLHVLGESFLAPTQTGVAKFLFNDQKIIRAYGPYSHANIFGAIIIFGMILLMSELWNRNKKITIFFGTIFGLGILVSFSRIAFLNVLLIFLFLLFKKEKYF